MEVFGYGGGFPKVAGEISAKNWEDLEFINVRLPRSLDDHVRSAIAAYRQLMDHYEDGSLISIEGDGEPIPVPLFDGAVLNPEHRERISVFTSEEANRVLADMGMQPTAAETRILDNVLNCYTVLVYAALNGRPVVARGPEESEFHIIPLNYVVEDFDSLAHPEE